MQKLYIIAKNAILETLTIILILTMIKFNYSGILNNIYTVSLIFTIETIAVVIYFLTLPEYKLRFVNFLSTAISLTVLLGIVYGILFVSLRHDFSFVSYAVGEIMFAIGIVVCLIMDGINILWHKLNKTIH